MTIRDGLMVLSYPSQTSGEGGVRSTISPPSRSNSGGLQILNLNPIPNPEFEFSLADGSALPAQDETFDFGQTVFGTAPITRQIYLKNLGSSYLSLAGTWQIISGASFGIFESSEFSRDYLEFVPSSTMIPHYDLSINNGELGLKEATIGFFPEGADSPSQTLQIRGEVITAETAYDRVLQTTNLTGAETLPSTSPQNDSVPNLLKYAFNMDFNVPDSGILSPEGTAGLPSGNLLPDSETPTWRFSYLERRGSGLQYQAQWSESLDPNSFTDLTGTETRQTIDDQWERVSIDVTIEANTKRFGRVSVSFP